MVECLKEKIDHALKEEGMREYVSNVFFQEEEYYHLLDNRFQKNKMVITLSNGLKFERCTESEKELVDSCIQMLKLERTLQKYDKARRKVESLQKNINDFETPLFSNHKKHQVLTLRKEKVKWEKKVLIWEKLIKKTTRGGESI